MTIEKTYILPFSSVIGTIASCNLAIADANYLMQQKNKKFKAFNTLIMIQVLLLSPNR
nr:hypothetical protein [Mycoplasmopsis bovis]